MPLVVSRNPRVRQERLTLHVMVCDEKGYFEAMKRVVKVSCECAV